MESPDKQLKQTRPRRSGNRAIRAARSGEIAKARRAEADEKSGRTAMMEKMKDLEIVPGTYVLVTFVTEAYPEGITIPAQYESERRKAGKLRFMIVGEKGSRNLPIDHEAVNAFITAHGKTHIDLQYKEISDFRHLSIEPTLVVTEEKAKKGKREKSGRTGKGAIVSAGDGHASAVESAQEEIIDQSSPEDEPDTEVPEKEEEAREVADIFGIADPDPEGPENEEVSDEEDEPEEDESTAEQNEDVDHKERVEQLLRAKKIKRGDKVALKVSLINTPIPVKILRPSKNGEGIDFMVLNGGDVRSFGLFRKEVLQVLEQAGLSERFGIKWDQLEDIDKLVRVKGKLVRQSE